MNILAVSYYNIWPLADTLVSVFFHQGKYLIDAPIGTGKSFLFFDGPLYGLYKYAERKLLNNLSEEWTIKILFSIWGEYYLIVRNLTPWKTKDSCVSEMYHLEDVTTEQLENWTLFKEQSLVVKDVDIADMLVHAWIRLEKITAKNEVDLNMSITSLLPPREVFVNTAFLMQDSGNIFELTPSNRLLVLKNIFGLLGIDEMKDKMSQIKRDIQTEKKILSDVSEKNTKLKAGLGKLRSVLWFFREHLSVFDFSPYQEAFQDLELVYDKVNIEKFALDEQFMVLYQALDEYLKQQSDVFTTLQAEYREKEHYYQQLQGQVQSKKQDIVRLQEEKAQLEQKIAASDPEVLERLKQEKKEKYVKLDALFDKTVQRKIKQFIDANSRIFEGFSWHEEYTGMKEAIQYLIDQGKVMKLEQENLENKILVVKEEYIRSQKELLTIKQQQVLSLSFQIKQRQQEITSIQDQTKDADERIVHLTTLLEEKLPFYQEKIAPEDFEHEIQRTTYVDIQQELADLQQEKTERLQKMGLVALQEQLQTYQNDQKHLQAAIDHLQKTCDVLAGASVTIPDQDMQARVQQLSKEKEQIAEDIQMIKTFLSGLDWKKILDEYAIYLDLQQRIKQLDQEIWAKEVLAKTLQQYQDACITKQTQIEQEEKQLSGLVEEIKSKQEVCTHLQQKLSDPSYKKLTSALEQLRSFDNILHGLQSLLADHQDTLLKVKHIAQEEVFAKNLYTIFSKDLLLFVLEDNLPVLSDIINNFLAHVVDFSLDMKLVQKGNSLELETMIHDDKWVRETKSLSWGQKVVLKLVWMLSVAVYLQSKMLFLDETINNLDPESIGKVSELIKNFVQQNAIKMYIITHSSEIKSMQIWDWNLDLLEVLQW